MARKKTEQNAEQRQFPSDVGREALEVAKRTTDSDEKSDRFVKVYVVGLPFDADFDHEPNLEVTHREAVNRGLHPKGDATFDGAEADDVDGNTRLTYSVEVVPAHVDHDSPEVVGQTPNK